MRYYRLKVTSWRAKNKMHQKILNVAEYYEGSIIEKNLIKNFIESLSKEIKDIELRTKSKKKVSTYFSDSENNGYNVYFVKYENTDNSIINIEFEPILSFINSENIGIGELFTIHLINTELKFRKEADND